MYCTVLYCTELKCTVLYCTVLNCTGHGRITIRAKCHLEVISNSVKGINRSKNAIVITELPYMTNKAGTSSSNYFYAVNFFYFNWQWYIIYVPWFVIIWGKKRNKSREREKERRRESSRETEWERELYKLKERDRERDEMKSKKVREKQKSCAYERVW